MSKDTLGSVPATDLDDHHVFPGGGPLPGESMMELVALSLKGKKVAAGSAGQPKYPHLPTDPEFSQIMGDGSSMKGEDMRAIEQRALRSLLTKRSAVRGELLSVFASRINTIGEK